MASKDENIHAVRVTPFPAGIPKGHQARDWGNSLESALTALHLTDVAREKLPAGKFDKLWPKSALEAPPSLPKDATDDRDRCVDDSDDE